MRLDDSWRAARDIAAGVVDSIPGAERAGAFAQSGADMLAGAWDRTSNASRRLLPNMGLDNLRGMNLMGAVPMLGAAAGAYFDYSRSRSQGHGQLRSLASAASIGYLWTMYPMATMIGMAGAGIASLAGGGAMSMMLSAQRDQQNLYTMPMMSDAGMRAQESAMTEMRAASTHIAQEVGNDPTFSNTAAFLHRRYSGSR